MFFLELKTDRVLHTPMKSQPRYSSLRSFIREILTEELVSIVRENDDEEIWDMDIVDDEISNAKKVTGDDGKIGYEALGLKQTDKERMDAAAGAGQKYSSVSRAQIARSLLKVQEESGSGGVRQPWPGIQEALKLLRAYWTDTMLWAPTNRKGRGEATLHMAFESVLQNEEPDFNVSSSERYSVKYFSNPETDTVRNGGVPSPAMKTALVAFAKAVYLDKWLKRSVDSSNVYDSFVSIAKQFGSSSNFKPNSLRNYLQAKGADDTEKKKTWAPKAEEALRDLKASILAEHKAVGMIVISPRRDMVDFISADSPGKIKIRYIQPDTRIAFGLEEMTDSLDKVIDELAGGSFDN